MEKELQGVDKWRERARRWDNYTCQICKKVWQPGTRRFDVHHLDPKMESTKNYAYDRDNMDKLMTLCHKCHLSLHTVKEKMVIAKKDSERYRTMKKQMMERANNMMELRRQGMYLKDIGKKFGITKQAVHSFMRRNFIKH